MCGLLASIVLIVGVLAAAMMPIMFGGNLVLCVRLISVSVDSGASLEGPSMIA